MLGVLIAAKQLFVLGKIGPTKKQKVSDVKSSRVFDATHTHVDVKENEVHLI